MRLMRTHAAASVTVPHQHGSLRQLRNIRLIREQVRTLAGRFDLDYWRERDAAAEYPHDFFAAFAEAGWLGIAIPSEYGGSGLGISEACILLEEICASGAGTSGASPIHFSIFPPMPLDHSTAATRRSGSFCPRSPVAT